MSELMSRGEFCSKLGITDSTAYYWRQIGKGPKGARIGKELRYRTADVEQWIDDQFAEAADRIDGGSAVVVETAAPRKPMVSLSATGDDIAEW